MLRKSTLNRTIKFLLILFGIWPGTSYILVCRGFWIITIGFIEFCHYRYFVTHIYSAELLDLIDCTCSFLAHAKVLIKFIVFWLNQGTFIEMLTMITDDWSDCANSEISMREMTLHAAGQIDILRCWLTHRVDENKHGSVVITIRKIIEKHQKVIEFSENIESLYTYIALSQFVSNTIMICSLGFLIVMAIGSPNVVEQILRSVLFYTITSLEAFIFCFAGEYLNNKSKAIGAAAYNSLWYNLKPKDSRVLLFMILRSQKQLTLTAGKMMDLSLQSFTTIMNASGSYLSMLLAMQ
ncbi:odorant receptor 4-like isoform X3 [Ooceraea biroi]|uniref:odorant receptor 4-like isoform X3 n=1 Tax=Ooceraea biroi TaxID=2015173 RepID=UPI000F080EB4|nr:odorant receptor 4-like isoform X3 [Ooceraea biroi]